MLLAVLAALKAADYWLTRYELTNERRGFVQGATYAVVNAQLPALMLLMLVALLTAGLFLSTIRTNRWRLPLVASALWLVVLLSAGSSTRRSCSRSIVRPNQGDREAPYIERNVIATRQAMGLGDVERRARHVRQRSRRPRSSPTSSRSATFGCSTRPRCESRFRVDRGEVAGLAIDDLDVDRYMLDGQVRSRCSSPPASSISAGAPTRAGRADTSSNTRGCGVGAGARPAGSRRRTVLTTRTSSSTRPELYFSPSMTSYAIARTDVAERGCGDDDVYEGTRGVQHVVVRCAGPRSRSPSSTTTCSARARSTTTRRCCGSATSRDRVEKLAPFLSFDGDPYPVVVDGAMQWVIDGYTTTSSYPYAQRIGNVAADEQHRDSRATRTTSATASRRPSTPTTAPSRSTSSTTTTRSCGRGSARSPICSRPIERDAGGAARAPALSRGPVPRADRPVLQVPARRPRTSSSARARGRSRRRPTVVAAASSHVVASPATPTDEAAATEFATESQAAAVRAVLHDVPQPSSPARRSSCCCARSCRSRATTCAPSCRPT